MTERRLPLLHLQPEDVKPPQEIILERECRISAQGMACCGQIANRYRQEALSHQEEPRV